MRQLCGYGSLCKAKQKFTYQFELFNMNSTIEDGGGGSKTTIHGNNPPVDRGKVVYLLFYLIGIATLLPWNFFINSRQYFMFKLRNATFGLGDIYYAPELGRHTDLQDTFETYLAIAGTLPNMFFLLLNTAVTKTLPLRGRMIVASLLMIGLFCLTVSLVRVNTDHWQKQFFIITMCTIVVMNACSAVLQGGLFGIAALFPSRYTQAAMAGMGLGGILASSVYVLALVVEHNPLHVAFGYFLTAALAVALALTGYLCLPLFSFARYYMARQQSERTVSVNVDDKQTPNGSAAEASETTALLAEQNRAPGLSLWAVFKKVRMEALCVFTVFFVTLACFPALASSIKSFNTSSAWGKTYFMPVTCFLFFNISDWLGRTFAGLVQWPHTDSKWLPVLTLLRFAFIPLFLLCNVRPRQNLPVVFNSDAYPSVLMVLFALSNGYLGTLFMMYGPLKLPLEDMEMGGSMLAFFLAAGLGAGTSFSYALLALV